jgi:hypothetical protein
MRKPKYNSFVDFLAAHMRGEVTIDRLSLICWSGSGSVTIELSPDEPNDNAEVLVKAGTAEEFAFDVIEALGGEGRMA